MKHYLITTFLLVFLSLPSFAQLNCDSIDVICQRAKELIVQKKEEKALNGLFMSKGQPDIRNCPDVAKIDLLISQIQNKETPGNSQNLTFHVNGVVLNMIFVEGGTFTMGNTFKKRKKDDTYLNELPAHLLPVESFYIGETEVTQALWNVVMQDRKLIDGDNMPANNISREEILLFLKRLNEMTESVRLEGCEFRLPLEHEWEFAARGGNKTHGYMYSGSDNANDVAWFGCLYNHKGKGNSGDRPHPVALLKPNELGIYDMSGNLAEACHNCYYRYEVNATGYGIIPSVSNDCSLFTIRGGSYIDENETCRVSERAAGAIFGGSANLGIRLVLK